MKKLLTLYEYSNRWKEVYGQRVYDENTPVFRVCDLSECPEDAIIGRDLFDAYDYLNAVKYGMELAKQGYDDVDYIVKDEKDKDDEE